MIYRNFSQDVGKLITNNNMSTKINIALSIPESDKPERYFRFRLQQNLHNEQSIYSNSSPIFVVSGMKNNFQAFCRLLKKQGIIDRYLKWKFKDGHLVILGNYLDRWEQMTECLWLIYALEEKARRKGGHVHFILGHQELINMNGPWRFMHPKYAPATLMSSKPPTALYDASHELWRWLQTKNIIEKIGSILFVPAGISEELLAQEITINDINNMARRCYLYSSEKSVKSAFQLLLNSNQSPLLYEGYLQGSATEKQVNTTLDQFNIKTIITSMTTGEAFNMYFSGKIINIGPVYSIDTPTGLLIKRGKFYLADSKGKLGKIR